LRERPGFPANNAPADDLDVVPVRHGCKSSGRAASGTGSCEMPAAARKRKTGRRATVGMRSGCGRLGSAGATSERPNGCWPLKGGEARPGSADAMRSCGLDGRCGSSSRGRWAEGCRRRLVPDDKSATRAACWLGLTLPPPPTSTRLPHPALAAKPPRLGTAMLVTAIRGASEPPPLQLLREMNELRLALDPVTGRALAPSLFPRRAGRSAGSSRIRPWKTCSARSSR
jgi:hypothetical protein